MSAKKASLIDTLQSSDKLSTEDSPLTAERHFLAEQLESRVLYSAAPLEVGDADQVSEVYIEADGGGFDSIEAFSGVASPDITYGDEVANVGPASGEVTEPVEWVSLANFDTLSQQELQTLVDAAAQRWADSGLSAAQLEALQQVEYEIVDLSGNLLGQADGSKITIDLDAAGQGWYVDGTPFLDEEFGIVQSSTAMRAEEPTQYGYDLLSVLMHEQGHVLGLEDLYAAADDTSVMYGWFEQGERRVAAEGEAAGAQALSLEGVQNASADALASLQFNEILNHGWSGNVATSIDVDGDGVYGDAGDQFIELVNTSSNTINVGGLEFWDPEHGNWFTVPSGTLVAAGGALTVVVNADGGGLPTVPVGSVIFDAGFDATQTPSLQVFSYFGGTDRADTIRVLDPSTNAYIEAKVGGGNLNGNGLLTGSTKVGSTFNFGTAVSGTSLVRTPDASGAAVTHASLGNGSVYASPGSLSGVPTLSVPLGGDFELDELNVAGVYPNGNIAGIRVGDSDSSSITVTLSILIGGELSVSESVVGGLTSGAISGQNSETLILTGSPQEVDATLQAGLFFEFPNTDDNNLTLGGQPDITIVVDDGLNQTSSTIGISLLPTNDAPVIDLPATQYVYEEDTLVFSASGGNAIVVSDVDEAESPGAELRVTLSVANGALNLGGVGGLSFLDGTSDGSSVLSFQGTLAAINAALDGLSYTGTLDFFGWDSLSITVNDLGNSGQDPSNAIHYSLPDSGDSSSEEATGVLNIGVVNVNDSPMLTLPATMETPIDAALAIPSGSLQVSDVDSSIVEIELATTMGAELSLSNTTGLTIFDVDGSDGTINVRGDLADVNSALNSLTVTPAAGYEGYFSVVVSVTDGVDSQVGYFSVLAGQNQAPTLDGAHDVVHYSEQWDNLGWSVNVKDLDAVDQHDYEGGLVGTGGLSYSLSSENGGGVDNSAFQINASTGELSFLIDVDFESPLDIDGDNIYHVQVSVTDSLGAATFQDIEVRVIDQLSTAFVSSAESLAEGDAGSTTFTFEVDRVMDVESAASVSYSVIGVGADGAVSSDFAGGVLASGVVSWAAGDASTQIITIDVEGDGLVEGDESFKVVLSNISNAAGGYVVGEDFELDADSQSLSDAAVSALTSANVSVELHSVGGVAGSQAMVVSADTSLGSPDSRATFLLLVDTTLNQSVDLQVSTTPESTNESFYVELLDIDGNVIAVGPVVQTSDLSVGSFENYSIDLVQAGGVPVYGISYVFDSIDGGTGYVVVDEVRMIVEDRIATIINDDTLPEIVITEIMFDPSAVDDTDGEYFELYNNGTSPIDINGWVLSDGTGSSHVIENGGPLIVAAGEYLVLGRNADSSANGGVVLDYVYSGAVFGVAADRIVLTDTHGNEVDIVVDDGGVTFPVMSGAAIELTDANADNNVGSNWVLANSQYGDGDLGTPGGSNDGGALTLSVTAGDVSIAENGGSTSTFTVTRSSSYNDNPLTVALSSADLGEATVPTTVVIPAGATSATFVVTAVDDSLADGQQTVSISADATGYTGGSDTIDILDDDDPALSLSTGGAATEGGANGTITISRNTEDNSAALTVTLASSDPGQASVPATIDIPAGESSVTFDVTAVDDAFAEALGSSVITASASGFESDTATVSVIDNDAPTLTVTAGAAITENGGGSTFTVSRNDADLSSPLTVTLSSSDSGEAVLPLTTVTIPIGSASVTFSVDPVDDAVVDGLQQSTITATAGGYVAGSAIATVNDDDVATLTVTAGADMSENGGSSTFTVSRNTEDNSSALTVTITSDDVGEADFSPVTVDIPAGQSSVDFVISAVDDGLADGAKAVTITGSASGFVSGSDVVSVTDDEIATLTVTAGADASENGGTSTFTVSRNTEDLSSDLVVNLTSADTGEAIPQVTSVTILAGQSTATFLVEGVDDSLYDGTKSVEIAATASGFVSGSDVFGVLDDEVQTLTLTAGTSPAAEGAVSTFTVSRNDEDLSSALTVSLTSDDISEAGVPATIEIPANQASVTFAVTAATDSVVDGDHVATISASATGYTGDSEALTISDVDVETLTLVAGDASIIETGATTSTFTVSRNTVDTSTDLVVTIASSDTSEATAPVTVTIPAGQSSQTFTVTAANDNDFDGTQEVTFTATSGAYVAGSDTIDVIDDDAPLLTVTAGAGSISETGGTSTFTVTRNTSTATALVVNLTSGDTSEATVLGTVEIPIGQESVDFTVSAVDDLLADGDQTVTVTASLAGYTSGSDTVVVQDNETPTLTLTAGPDFSENGGSSQFTVSRNTEDNSSPLTVTITSDDIGEAIFAPVTVEIPAGQSSASFTIDGVDDSLADGTQVVSFTASAVGFVDGTDSVQVTDDEVPTLSVTAGADASENGGSSTFTVTRNTEDNSSDLVVNLSSADIGEALPQNATVTILAGQSSATFVVNTVDDNVFDGSQTVQISAAATGFVGGFDSFAVLDDDVQTLTVTAGSAATEGGASTFTVSRNDEDLSTALTVSLSSDDLSEAGVPATVEIPANQTSVTFVVTAATDDFVDGDQVATISAAATGYVGASDTLTVADVDVATLTVAAGSSSVTEAGTTSTFTVTRNTDTTNALVIDIASSDSGEASAPLQVTIPAGQASHTFTVTGQDDSNVDGTQNVTISASAATFVSGSDTIDVLDDDSPLLTVTAGAGPISEAGGASTFTVTRNTDVTQALVVDLLSDDTSEATVLGSVEIPAGQASHTFSVTAVDDSLSDGDKTVSISASATGFTGGSDTLVVQDDESPALTLTAGAAMSENGGTSTFTISRNTEDTSSPLLVSLAGDDASEASVPASVTIPAGQSSVTFDVTAVNDALADGSQSVTITATAGGFANDTAAVSVTDDEVAAISLALVNVTTAEGAVTEQLQISRNTEDLSTALVVNLASDDTSEVTVPVSGTFTIPVGVATTTFTVDIVDDGLADGTQLATVTATAAGYDSGTVTLSIIDDETPTLTVTAGSAIDESGGSSTFTVSRNTEDISSDLTVLLSSGDTSEASVPTSVTILAGQSSATFAVSAVDDAVLDGTQSVVISASATGYTGGSDSVDVTDDESPRVTVAAGGPISENGGSATFTVTRNTDTTGPLTVNLLGDDASEAAIPATVTILAGNVSQTFTVTAVDDALADGDKTVNITASAAGHDSGSAVFTVTDDEVAALDISGGASSIAENAGAATSFTISRNTEDISAPLTVTLTSSDTGEATVLGSVTILAGQSSASFDVTPSDDALADGDQSITISAMAAGYVGDDEYIDITDDEVPTLTVTAGASSTPENGAPVTFTVSRNTEDLSSALTVNLSSDDTGEATVPATVDIPAGQSSVTFSVSPQDDGVIDVTQTVTITAANGSFTSGSDTVDITPRNEAPVANADTATATEAGGIANGTAAINPSGNVVTAPGGTSDVTDTDYESDTLTVTQVSHGGGAAVAVSGAGSSIMGAYGTLTIDSTGSYSYVLDDIASEILDAGDSVNEIFTYTISDGISSSSATLTVAVQGADDAPVATDITATARETGSFTAGVDPTGTAAFSDGDADDTPSVVNVSYSGGGSPIGANAGGAVSAPTVVDGQYGTLTIDVDGSYTYQVDQIATESLDIGDTVVDQFTYTIESPGGLTDVATLSIDVHGAYDDTAAPAPTISGPSGQQPLQPLTVTVDFGEAVSSFTAGDLVVTNASVASIVDNGGGNFSVTLVPTAEGVVTIDLPANQTTDLAGNLNLVANSYSVLVDSAPSVIISGPTGVVTTESFDIDISFSEPVTGFTISDLVIANGAVTGVIDNGDNTYTVTVSSIEDGQVNITVPNNAVVDATGNASTVGNYSVDVDARAPGFVGIRGVFREIVDQRLFVGIYSPDGEQGDDSRKAIVAVGRWSQVPQVRLSFYDDAGEKMYSYAETNTYDLLKAEDGSFMSMIVVPWQSGLLDSTRRITLEGIPETAWPDNIDVLEEPRYDADFASFATAGVTGQIVGSIIDPVG